MSRFPLSRLCTSTPHVTANAPRAVLIEHMTGVLTSEQAHRGSRKEFVDGEVEWVLREREAMVAAVAALRPDLTAQAVAAGVEAAERSAHGHSDYTTKFAMRCAFFVEENRVVSHFGARRARL